MLRFYLNTLDKIKQWPTVLSQIQAVLNNSSSATTKKTPNEVVYRFTLNQPLDIISGGTDLVNVDMTITHMKVYNAIAFVNMNTKHHYDRKHQPMFLKVSDYALLRLHKGYLIPSADNHKLSQQYVGPFRVLAQVGRLAYQLNIPEH